MTDEQLQAITDLLNEISVKQTYTINGLQAVNGQLDFIMKTVLVGLVVYVMIKIVFRVIAPIAYD